MKTTVDPFRGTLFVVGAGAHKPYNMPTSADLTSTLKKLFLAPKYSGITNYNPTREEQLKDQICRIAKGLSIIDAA